MNAQEAKEKTDLVRSQDPKNNYDLIKKLIEKCVMVGRYHAFYDYDITEDLKAKLLEEGYTVGDWSNSNGWLYISWE